jgi:threonine 3-dehydrogenase
VQKLIRAVVKAERDPGLWLQDVPVPEVGGDDVLIRVLKASICGTDVHIYNLGRLGAENHSSADDHRS